jgi:hypothetical protein
MTLTFQEMAINAADYNGMTYQKARPWIINRACDFVMHTYFANVPEIDLIEDYGLIELNIVRQTVTFPFLATTH